MIVCGRCHSNGEVYVSGDPAGDDLVTETCGDCLGDGFFTVERSLFLREWEQANAA